MLFGASGKMKELTAEQKSFELVQSFLAALVTAKGEYPRGDPPWERFAYFFARKSKCLAGTRRLLTTALSQSPVLPFSNEIYHNSLTKRPKWCIINPTKERRKSKNAKIFQNLRNNYFSRLCHWILPRFFQCRHGKPFRCSLWASHSFSLLCCGASFYLYCRVA